MQAFNAFVYAHNCHRHNADSPGKFQDCMEERIRLMTASTPAYAHANQAICLTRSPLDTPCQRFRSPSDQAECPNLPNIRTTTRNKGDDNKGWAVFTDGGTHAIHFETTAGWGAIARSPEGRLCIMFGLVITTETHLGARLHINNSAERSIEALSFFEPSGLVARGSQACIFVTQNTLPTCAWERFNHARRYLWV